MHLVEAEAVGPIEGDTPLVTPPRPPHRRVSVSLLFTLSILIGTVVTIYLVLPARDNVIVTEAIAAHRATDGWDFEKPSASEVRAWAVGVAGKEVPLPSDLESVIGVRRIQVLKRNAAVIRMQIGPDQITYVVTNARGITPKHLEVKDDDVIAREWRRGKFTCVAVGPTASSTAWLATIAK